MTSTKYIGYVGGVAVAAGVGAAIAVAGQGTAGADATDSGAAAKASTSSSSSVKAGPKRNSGVKTTKADKNSTRTKPRSLVNDRVEKVASHVTSQLNKTASTVSKSITDSLHKPSVKPVKPKAKPSAEEFEAKQVERLKKLFTPKQAATPKPDDGALEDKPASTPVVRTAVESHADTTADGPTWNPNPFRPDDPDPTDIPEPIMELREALRSALPAELDPFVREGVEQAYRASQIVPWVNAVVPISKILPSLAPAVGDTPEARDARQIIINELIKTTPPGSLLYYGYDIAADLLNFDNDAAELKQQFFTSAWDILDPFELAHNEGTSGIGQAAG
ncbi:hypothetical protein M1247_20775 [Mycobacterium sp. 21AC1]|uniref:hypothetical protein n=1 Tax=[Mycobacterium] appelbergii TaxID=2939269 RepID=UPI0029392053|nr:hypothetical protein [Mycobacterium sp. 21AC1]MDV3127371.1 hypothetical protein [Mycobacterium sp. 21AC1]